MVSTFIDVYSKLGNCGVDLENKEKLGLKLGLGTCFNFDLMQILIAGSFG